MHAFLWWCGVIFVCLMALGVAAGIGFSLKIWLEDWIVMRKYGSWEAYYHEKGQQNYGKNVTKFW